MDSLTPGLSYLPDPHIPRTLLSVDSPILDSLNPGLSYSPDSRIPGLTYPRTLLSSDSPIPGLSYPRTLLSPDSPTDPDSPDKSVLATSLRNPSTLPVSCHQGGSTSHRPTDRPTDAADIHILSHDFHRNPTAKTRT